VSDPLRDRCLDALRRNALLSGVIEEGYRPSEDAALRDRVRRAMTATARWRRARRLLLGVAAALLLLGIGTLFRAPEQRPSVVAPAIVISPPAPAFVIVTTADAAPLFELVPTPAASGLEVVHTAQLIGPLERARDEELLAANGVVGIVGHPGGVRKLILSTPVPRRFLE
jgi:hypothetical protein